MIIFWSFLLVVIIFLPMILALITTTFFREGMIERNRKKLQLVADKNEFNLNPKLLSEAVKLCSQCYSCPKAFTQVCYCLWQVTQKGSINKDDLNMMRSANAYIPFPLLLKFVENSDLKPDSDLKKLIKKRNNAAVVNG